MRIWWLFLCLFMILGALAGCKGGESATGRYRIEQDNNLFGEGVEKFDLDLKDDKTFAFTVGTIPMGTGAWTSDGSKVKLAWTSGSLGEGKSGVDFKLEPGKLVPLDEQGKELTTWRFVKK